MKYLGGKSEIKRPKDELGVLREFVNEVYQSAQHGHTLNEEKIMENIERLNGDLDVFAFYLPQFHECEVNNKAWGQGFTEWTNVTRAKPQFIGHYQPRLPGEFGFYDLTHPDVIEKQIDLAKNYGLAGFCFHYYWFSGKQLLFEPIQKFMDSQPENFSFIVNWANENWTRRWDGQDNEIILKNEFDNFDLETFFNDLLPIISHKNYREFAPGIPWVSVYRPELLPDPMNFVEGMCRLAKTHGFKGLHLSMCRSFDQRDPKKYGFNSSIEFPPHGVPNYIRPINHQSTIVNRDFKGHIYNMSEYSEIYEQTHTEKENGSEIPLFRTTFPSWDNEARKPGKGTAFVGTTPQEFLNWTSVAANLTSRDAQDRKVMFINAWNEWAEGAYLEPDRKYGHAYLNSLGKVIHGYKNKNLKLQKKVEEVSSAQGIKKTDKKAVVLHLFYPSLVDEFAEVFSSLTSDFDFFVSVSKNLPPMQLETITNKLENCTVVPVENRGRDILPFISLVKKLKLSRYQAICKIHSKLSAHRTDGKVWRQSLVDGLLGSQKIIQESLSMLQEGSGIVAPKKFIKNFDKFVGSNRSKVEQLCKVNSISFNNQSRFVAGTMFWTHQRVVEAIENLSLEVVDFEHERLQIDGTMAHACERFFGMLCENLGLKVDNNSYSVEQEFKVLLKKDQMESKFISGSENV